MTPTLAPVRSSADLVATAELFVSYAASLPIDLAYQDFATELTELPGKYAPPAGDLLLARDGHGRPTGCVGLRPLPTEGACEMKRLYVAPAGRGQGLGKALVEAILATAGRLGYREMRLDTLPSMRQALALYAGLGFTEVAPYYDTPVAGTIFLARRLGD